MSEATTVKYSVLFRNSEHVLRADGRDCFCPFAPSVIVPGQIAGSGTLMRMPCSSNCPLARLELQGEQLKYSVSCGHSEKSFDVEPEEAPNNNPLIKPN